MVAVDLEPRIKLEHMHALPNLRFPRADVTSPHFAATLETPPTTVTATASPGTPLRDPARSLARNAPTADEEHAGRTG